MTAYAVLLKTETCSIPAYMQNGIARRLSKLLHEHLELLKSTNDYCDAKEIILKRKIEVRMYVFGIK